MKRVDMSCCFCREAVGLENKNLSHVYPEVADRTLFRSGALRLIPCIGQLVPNHLMIVSDAHYNSFGQALSAESELNEQLASAIAKFRQEFSTDGRFFMFEHGVSGPELGGCGIYHAHIHIMPASHELLDGMHSFVLEDVEVATATLDDLLAAKIALPENYFLLGGNEGLIYQALTVPVQSQYLRRKVAEALGVGEWNWRNFGRQQSFMAHVAA